MVSARSLLKLVQCSLISNPATPTVSFTAYSHDSCTLPRAQDWHNYE